jgi:hypothetical protein
MLGAVFFKRQVQNASPMEALPLQGQSRRAWLAQVASASTAAVIGAFGPAQGARADEWTQPPEEVSGLVVLRVAEVAAFQEKILRLAASGEDVGLQLAPIQFVYGTKILLKNSNLDGNMKLMIETEVPRKKRSDAVKNAVVIMNTFGEIERKAAGLIEFTPEDMLEIADLYARSRAELATMFEYLPPQEQERYMFYANALRAYEQNLAAEPDVDV